MDSAIATLLVNARKAHPTWGPRKILAWIARKHPEAVRHLPAASTVGDLFKREKLVEPVRRRRPQTHPGVRPLHAMGPNDVWCADYKGEFRLLDGEYCYPFTLTDAFSRYLLCCQAESSTALLGTKQALTEAFRRFGLPRAIRTDNGTPFVGHGLSGLSQLAVWWMKLGIDHQRIQPGRPDQNGRHERMHKTLKAECTRPPGISFATQQARFDAFVDEFNGERPHEALGQQPPTSQYHSSPRAFPEVIPGPEYPSHYEIRKVDANGRFKFKGTSWFVAHPLTEELLGLVEIEEEVWSIQFYGHEVARLNPRLGTYVIKVSPMSPV
jgi:transposase InsO family protein